MALTREQVQAYLDERDEQDCSNPEMAAWEFAVKSIDIAPDLADALLHAWDEVERWKNISNQQSQQNQRLMDTLQKMREQESDGTYCEHDQAREVRNE